MARQIPVAQLVVEGKDDQHVIWALCNRHSIPETFAVVTPDDESGGIDELLNSIPIRLKISGLRALGLVIDADQNLQGRWEAVCHRLRLSGYQELPDQPNSQGTIIERDRLPRVGIGSCRIINFQAC